MSILEKVESPKDIKKMTIQELSSLAEEIRAAVLKRNSLIGGHVGPNLGFVEATIALHYVFNSPKDKIVFDVSHQCYPHKIITGRKNGFLNPEDYSKISGYTNPKESEHDHFVVGHTSTSISLASGLAKARDILGENHNVIAVIGDGSLSGGEALEGLNFAGSELNSNFIVVINDNGMSIAENHGGLYENLALLRQTKGTAELNLFKALGFDYTYVEKGNDIEELISAFNAVKNTKKPVVVHLKTEKGKGYALAEKNKEQWHWHIPFDIKNGQSSTKSSATTYNDITTTYFGERIEDGEPIVLMTAGTPGVFGFTPEFRKSLGKNYVDVGIAEEHAVAMASAMAKGGARPVFFVNSSFITRTYDQLSQDLALNRNPALILVFNGGISGVDATHLGVFDISMISNIPNIIYLSPATLEEYIAMLDWAMLQTTHPVVMRVPQDRPISGGEVDDDFSEINYNHIIEEGTNIAIITEGQMLDRACEVLKGLKEHNINPTLINARYLNDVDQHLLTSLEAKHKIVITLESGILSGGYGQKVAHFYGARPMRVLSYGAAKEFTDREPLTELNKRFRLNADEIIEDTLKLYDEIK